MSLLVAGGAWQRAADLAAAGQGGRAAGPQKAPNLKQSRSGVICLFREGWVGCTSKLRGYFTGCLSFLFPQLQIEGPPFSQGLRHQSGDLDSIQSAIRKSLGDIGQWFRGSTGPMGKAKVAGFSPEGHWKARALWCFG